MKTPIQEVLETYEVMLSLHSEMAVSVRSVVEDLKSHLEKEKEVIIETSKNSYIAGYLDNQAKIDESMNFPNEYYNTTFNTKDNG